MQRNKLKKRARQRKENESKPSRPKGKLKESEPGKASVQEPKEKSFKKFLGKPKNTFRIGSFTQVIQR